MTPIKKHADNEDMRGECGNVARILLTSISHRVLRTIIRHLAAAVDILTRQLFGDA